MSPAAPLRYADASSGSSFISCMEFPLIDKTLFPGLRLVHGFYNSCMMLLFVYQGWTGFTIRRARLAGGALPFTFIRRHRRSGPVAAVLGSIGFFLGLSLVLLDTGRVLEYPSHLAAGSILVAAIIVTYGISRKIKSPDSAFRKPHMTSGIAVLVLYLIEVFLGIGVLL